MDLQYVQQLLVHETRQTMASLATQAGIDTKAVVLRNLSRLFQGVGICQLLVSADIARFRENLIRSGHARRWFLQRAWAEAALDNRFLGLSRSDAIFDVIVACDPALARDIADLSLEEWDPGRDYEDDYCYFLIVHRIATRVGFRDDPEFEQLVRRFTSVLEGKSTPRLEVCIAYQRGDAEAMRSALEDFLAVRRDSLDERRAGITEYSAQAIFWPQSFVSIEALAWLALSGGPPELDDVFLYCPPEARRPWRFDTPPAQVEDFFKSLRLALDEAGP